MKTLLSPIALAMVLGVAAPAIAQEAAEEPLQQPGAELSLGEPAEEGGIGSSYVAETFNDWELICLRTEEGNDPCEMYQLLQDENDNAVAEITMIALPPGQEAAAGANIVTPLGTLLTQQLTLRVDSGEARRYPFSWCNAMGCIARVGFTAAEVEAFRRGGQATLTIVSVEAPEQPVNATMSLMGFTAAFNAVTEANAEN